MSASQNLTFLHYPESNVLWHLSALMQFLVLLCFLLSRTRRQLMTCGKTAHRAMEFTFTSKGEYSSTSLNLLNIHPQLHRGTQDMGESGSHRRTRQYNSQPRTGLFFFFFCKFETYVNVISNHNSCCKSDSSNFCCMILFFVKCNCPCTKCSYLIMNCFKSLSKLQKLFGLLCDAADKQSFQVMLCLDLGSGQGEQQPCQLDAQIAHDYGE